MIDAKKILRFYFPPIPPFFPFSQLIKRQVLQFRNEKLYELINVLDDCKRIGVKEMDIMKIRDALLKLNENIYVSSLKEIEVCKKKKYQSHVYI